MTISAVPPGLVLILGAALLPFLGGWWRKGLVLALPLLVLWMVWQVPDGVALSAPFLDYTLEIVKGDRVSRLFASIFAFMAFAGGLYALSQERVAELSAAFVYSGAAIGVTFAGDLITVFAFWEVMALASTLIIWIAGTEASRSAGMRYVAVHLLGGVLLMIGIVDYIGATGSIVFGAGPIQEILGLDRPGTWLILAGFLINAGAPPLSAWLPDAYPEASYSGMVFLSAFTTKTAVYVLLRGFPGFEVLTYVGLYMVFYGIIYALLENDARRILAYSIVNQVGFMVCGIGIGTEMALNGAASHAFTHIVYKALLLMSAGSVVLMTGGLRKCTDLGGLFHSMPVTAICGIVGALSISSFPLTSGFISKSMISQGAADEHMAAVWFLLLAASAGVFLHAGIKFPWFVFFQRDSGLRPPDPPWHMKAAMILMAVACIGLGVYPAPLYGILPYPVDYVPYTVAHVTKMLQLLLASGVAFFVLLFLMKRTLTISLDFDWFYRVFGAAVARVSADLTRAAQVGAVAHLRRQGERAAKRLFDTHGPDGIVARTWQTGSAVVWMAILLGVYLVIYYL